MIRPWPAIPSPTPGPRTGIVGGGDDKAQLEFIGREICHIIFAGRDADVDEMADRTTCAASWSAAKDSDSFTSRP